MYSLRRAACRLLASPSPIPVRSRLTATPNTHHLAIRYRNFSQSRWIGDEIKTQLESKDTATAQSPTANATATNSTLTDPNDVPVAPNDIAVNEAENEEMGMGSEDGLNTATTATTATTSNEPASFANESEVGKTQEHGEDSTASTATTNAYQESYKHPSTSAFDVSQIREAARLEDEAAQRTMTKEERIELMRQSRNEPKETIFIGNLFYDVTAEDLKAQMSKYGVVEGVNIIYDSRGISKGYGYVQFDNTDSADRAIQAMHMRVFEGRRVTLYFAQTNMRTATKAFAPTNTLYIGNMPFEMTDRDLNELFKDLANVFDVRVTVDRQTGQFRGYVHAEFTDVQSAAIGLERLSRHTLYGRKLKVYYSNNLRKAQRGSFPVGA